MDKFAARLVKSFNDKDLGTHDLDWVAKYRSDAINLVGNLGIPKLSDEDWRFTNLKDFASKDFSTFSGNEATFKKPKLPDHISSIDGFFIYTHNGILVSDSDYPFSFSKIKDSFDTPEIKETLYSQVSDKNKDFFYELSSAFIEDGIFLKVDKDIKIDKPIVIINSFDSEANLKFINSRNIFYFEDSSSAEIIEYSVSNSDNEYFWNKTTNVYVGNNSKVEHLLIENGSKSSFIFSNLKIIQERDSHFTTNSILCGGSLIRNNVHPMLNGEGCYSNILGLYLSIKEQLMDNYMFVEHLKENCGSRQLYKGLLDDSSRGVFHGRILVHEEAQQTNAYQTNRNLLLSDSAQVDTKPQLEIYADDVKCSHGATIGQIDKDALMYLQARGINKKKALAMLIRAFTDEVVEPIDSEKILDVFHNVVNDWFSRSKIMN
ncbi:Fe-S cluster assembly protein SufD [bacterium]|nr:Fe-S cluster assembly protein SufD [bacterium]